MIACFCAWPLITILLSSLVKVQAPLILSLLHKQCCQLSKLKWCSLWIKFSEGFQIRGQKWFIIKIANYYNPRCLKVELPHDSHDLWFMRPITICFYKILCVAKEIDRKLTPFLNWSRFHYTGRCYTTFFSDVCWGWFDGRISLLITPWGGEKLCPPLFLLNECTKPF